LDELLSTNISNGSLMPLEDNNLPSAFTVITEQDIQNSNFRNLYDLIEVYVPNALWMNHYDNKHLGIRGLIGDRNNKFLLIVNGRLFNNKGHAGAISELENWNLNDIKKITILRGTGSVIFGTAAAAGTIIIETKSYSKALEANASFTTEYNNLNFDLSTSGKIGSSAYYLYGSISSTPGIQNPEAGNFFNNQDFGYYYDSTLNFSNAAEPSDYFYDYNDVPQIKLHLDFRIDKNSRFWARYNQAGSGIYGVQPKSAPLLGFDTIQNGNQPAFYVPELGENINFMSNRIRTFSMNYEKDIYINSLNYFNNIVSYDYADYLRRGASFVNFPPNFDISNELLQEITDPNHLRNLYYNYGEHELYLKSIFNNIYSSKFKQAALFELSYNTISAPFGEGSNRIRLGDQYNFISGENSDVFNDFDPLEFPIWRNLGGFYPNSINNSGGDTTFFVGDGWSTLNIGLAYEAEFANILGNNILLSARLDKHSYSNFLFSPRFSISRELDEQNSLRLTGYRFERNNGEQALYSQNQRGVDPESEVIYGSEIAYNLNLGSLQFRLYNFYNFTQVINWNEWEETTNYSGDLQTAGFEFEAFYNIVNLSIIFNHSFTKMIDWKKRIDSVTTPISYSAYNFQIGEDKFIGVGNNLNNWSNHITKLNVNYNLNDIVHFNINTQIYWKHEGSLDGVQMLKNIEKEPDSDLANMVDFIEDNMYGTNIMLNAGISFTYFDNIRINLFANNILGEFNRYIYEDGIKTRNSYFRGGFVSEPTSFTIGLQLNI
jgi:outer membrane receptor protein involved in Fe transport